MTLSIERAKEVLQKTTWEHQNDYGGYNPLEYYVIYSRDRDSQILVNVNYTAILETLERMNPTDYENEAPAHDFRASRWPWLPDSQPVRAVGWIEYIIVKNDAPNAMLIKAAEIVCALAYYPVLDEKTYSDAQWDAMIDYWDSCSMSDRIDYCRDNGDSIFAARSDIIPDGVLNEFRDSKMFN